MSTPLPEEADPVFAVPENQSRVGAEVQPALSFLLPSDPAAGRFSPHRRRIDQGASPPSQLQAIASTGSPTRLLDIVRLPRLIEEGLGRAVKTQQSEPASTRNRRDPVLSSTGRLWSKVDVRRAVGVPDRFVHRVQ